jgi:hypothetical protein
MPNIEYCIWDAVCKKGTACKNKRGGLLYITVYELALYGGLLPFVHLFILLLTKA